MNRLILLGTGTCQIQADRMASSVLLELEATRVVYDMGRGICQRLHELGLKNNDVEHVVLSHFHPDHFSDLVPFLCSASWSRIDHRTKDLHLYGPTGVKDLANKIIDVCGPNGIVFDRFKLEVHEIDTKRFSIGSIDFDFIPLSHPNNHGLRFVVNGLQCALSGDADYDQKEVDFFEASNIAVVDSGHISDEQICDLALKTQVKQLYCSHLYRELDSDELNLQASKLGYRGEIIIGQDLMEIEL